MNSKYALIRLTLFTLLALLAAAPPARAANANPPGKMTFQGFVTDAANPPVPLGNSSPENKTVVFKIYKSATGAASADVLWAESQVVTIDKGHFSVLLGEGSAVTGFTDKHPTDLSGVFIGADASDRWIGITVDGSEMTPRIQFFAAPYAQLAKAANSLVNPSGGTILNLANGKLEGAADMSVTGSVTSSGSVAGLIFNNREGGSGTGSVWQWYSTGGTARLWSVGDKLTVTSDGSMTLTGGATITGAATANGGLTVNGKFNVKDGGVATFPAGIMTEVNSSLLQFGINEGSANRFGTANTASQGGMFRFDARSGTPVMSIFTRPAGENSGAGAERFVVLGNGNIGIGTSNPENNKLQVFGLVDTDDYPSTGQHAMQFRIKNGQGTSSSRALEIGLLKGGKGVIQVNESNVGYNALLLNPVDGNVGIGTSSPSSKLEVSGTLGLINGNKLDLGIGKADRNSAAGTIGYELYGAGALHIVGAGSGSNPRNIRMWDRIGIGTDGPEVPLHVATSADNNFSYYTGIRYGYGFLLNWGGDHASDEKNVSIKAAGGVTGNFFYTTSDARIKVLADHPEGQELLDGIRRLQVADYSYVDHIANGRRVQRGLIAQEVEKVMPEAVSQGRGVIPDIYARAVGTKYDVDSKSLTITLEKPHGLKADEVVSLIMDSGKTETKVIAVPSDTSLVVHVESKPEGVFVFGRQVDDFRTVNYDRIFATGIGAIQELDRQVQALKKSEARIAELEQKTARMAELELKAARVDSLEREMAELKKLVAEVASEARRGTEPVAASSRSEAAIAAASR